MRVKLCKSVAKWRIPFQSMALPGEGWIGMPQRKDKLHNTKQEEHSMDTTKHLKEDHLRIRSRWEDKMRGAIALLLKLQCRVIHTEAAQKGSR